MSNLNNITLGGLGCKCCKERHNHNYGGYKIAKKHLRTIDDPSPDDTLRKMSPFDEVTLKEQLEPFCIGCGSSNIHADEDQPPFYGDNEKTYLIVPFVCGDCQYSFSVNIEFIANVEEGKKCNA